MAWKYQWLSQPPPLNDPLTWLHSSCCKWRECVALAWSLEVSLWNKRQKHFGNHSVKFSDLLLFQMHFRHPFFWAFCNKPIFCPSDSVPCCVCRPISQFDRVFDSMVRNPTFYRNVHHKFPTGCSWDKKKSYIYDPLYMYLIYAGQAKDPII